MENLLNGAGSLPQTGAVLQHSALQRLWYIGGSKRVTMPDKGRGSRRLWPTI